MGGLLVSTIEVRQHAHAVVQGAVRDTRTLVGPAEGHGHFVGHSVCSNRVVPRVLPAGKHGGLGGSAAYG